MALLPEAAGGAETGTEISIGSDRVHARGGLLDAELFLHFPEAWTVPRPRLVEGNAETDEVVEPEAALVETKDFISAKDWYFESVRVTRNLFVKADTLGRSFKWWELALVGKAADCFISIAERIADVYALASLVNAQMAFLRCKHWVPNVAECGSLAEAVLKPPSVREHFVAIQSSCRFRGSLRDSVFLWSKA